METGCTSVEEVEVTGVYSILDVDGITSSVVAI